MQWYLISNCNNTISYKLKAKLLWMRKIAAMCVLPWQMGDTSLFNPWDPLSINCERLEIVRFLLDSFWTFPKKVTDKKQTKREYFLLDINNRVKAEDAWYCSTTVALAPTTTQPTLSTTATRAPSTPSANVPPPLKRSVLPSFSQMFINQLYADQPKCVSAEVGLWRDGDPAARPDHPPVHLR